MYEGRAVIIQKNEDALSVVASAARISTTEGSALALFSAPQDAEKNLKLVKKVLASGHKSLMEHQTFSIAFDRVSVLVEQFLIEHRLASFIVKSRRYVDFADAGYFVPGDLTPAMREKYVRATDDLFRLYSDLVEFGIPKEDARFVLPYAFYSNFYVTLNARTLIAVICEMRYGRAAGQPELFELGAQLEAQFEALYPGVIAAEQAPFALCAARPLPEKFRIGDEANGAVELLSATKNPEDVLERALRFSGRFEEDVEGYVSARNMRALVKDARPRELEFLTAQFLVKSITLSCVTHFTRHRMLSILVPDVAQAFARGDYVVPASVRANPELLERYRRAFVKQAELGNALIAQGMPAHDAAYLALSGHVMDILIEMNARELLHFIKLRTCTRAQWEIRRVARAMLEKLKEYDEEIFWVFGPSCYVDGKCPEGKLSCGNPAKG